MSSVLSVDANALVKSAASELKKNPAIQAPDWLHRVKSGVSRDRLPEERDFWFLRCASLLRKLSVHGSKGVQRFRHEYGGRKEHKVREAHHKKGGGKIVRVALQQLEKAGLVKKEKTGRVITPAGQSLLDKAAAGLTK